MAITLKAQARTVKGKKVKTLRHQGLVPAEVYGKGGDNVSIQIEQAELSKALKEAGTTSLISLDVDGASYDVLVKEVIRSLDRKSIVHTDLYSVDKNTKVKAVVPIKLIGESPLVTQGGIAVAGASEIEVVCLPNNIPSFYEVDTTPLEDFSDIITIGDVKVEDDVEVVSNTSTMVAYVSHTRATREAEAMERAEARGEVYVPMSEEGAEGAEAAGDSEEDAAGEEE